MVKVSLFLISLLYCIVVEASPAITISQPIANFSGITEVSSPSLAGTMAAFVGTDSATGISQAYLRDAASSTSTIISKNSSGEAGDASARNVQISADGKTVTFMSNASNLTSDSSTYSKLFIYDVASGTLSNIIGYDGNPLDNNIQDYALARDSKDIVFTSIAANVVENNPTSSQTTYFYDAGSQSTKVLSYYYAQSFAGISDDGSTAVSYSGNYCYYLVHDTNNPFSANNLNISCNSSSARLSEDGKDLFLAMNSYNYNQGYKYKLARYDINAEELTELAVPGFLKVVKIAGISSDKETILIAGQSTAFNQIDLWTYKVADGTLNLINVDVNGKKTTFNNVSDVHFSSSTPKITYVGTPQTGNPDDDFTQALLVDPLQISASAPPAASILSASTSEIAKVNLSWTPPESGVSFYLIYRQLAGVEGKGTYVGAANSAATSFTDEDSGLDASETYTYSIESCSELFKCASTTVEGGQLVAPQKVEGLYVENNSESNYQRVWWNVVDGANYEVLRRENFQSSTSIKNNNYIDLSYNYYNNVMWIQVRACIKGVCGQYSDPLQVEPKPSKSIENIRYYVDQTFSQVVLAWDPVEFAHHYRIYTAQSRESNNWQFKQTVTKEEFTDTSVDLSLGLAYAVEACDQFDNCGNKYSIDVNSVNQTSIEQQASPTFNTYTYKNHYEIFGSSKYENIKIYRRTEQFGAAILITDIPVGINGDFSFSDSDVEPETKYYYYIEGCTNNICVRSMDKITQALTTYYVDNLATIDDLTASFNTYQNEIHLKWSFKGEATGVIVMRDGYSLRTLSHGETEFVDLSIVEGKQYAYQVVPYLHRNYSNSAGLPSNVAYGSTAYLQGEAILPATPVLHASKERYYDKIVLNWNSVGSGDYYLFFATSVDGPYLPYSQYYNGYSFSATWSNLAPGLTTYFKIKACRHDFCSPLSDAVMGSTSDVLAVPVLLASISDISLTSDNKVQLTVPTVDGATYYQILRKTAVYTTDEITMETTEFPYVDETASPDTSYYYRVQACNAAGCSAPSDLSDIVTGFENTSVYLDTYAIWQTRATTSRIRVEFRKQNYGSKPVDHVNFYYATSAEGIKTLLMTIQDVSYSGFVDLQNADAGTSYFFWLESCYGTAASEHCVLEPHYWVDQLDSPASVTIPLPSQPEFLPEVDHISIKNFWLPYGTSMHLYVSDSQDGSPTLTRTFYANSSAATVSSDEYLAKAVWVSVDQCDSNSNCSERTAPVAVTLPPRHTNQLSMYTENTLGTKLRYSEPSSQFLYTEQGMTSSFDVYIPKSEQVFSGCYYYFDFRFDSDNYRFNFKDLISLYAPSTYCSSHNFRDSTKLYLVLGEDFTNPIVIDSSLLGKWTSFKVNLTNNGSINVFIDNKLVGSKSLPEIVLLKPKFAKLELNSDSSQVLVKNLQASSSQDFGRNRPKMTSLSAYVDNSTLRISWSTALDADSVHVRVFPEKDGDWTNPVIDQDTSVNAPIIYVPSGYGKYLVQVSACKSGLCSRALYDIETISQSNYLSTPKAPVLTENQENGQVIASLSAVSGASYYKIYVNDEDSWSIYNYKLWALTTSLSVALTDLQYTDLYVRVVACNANDVCSSNSSSTYLKLTLDRDKDGLLDQEEFVLGTDPLKSDTDGDGISDYDEVNKYKTNPLNTDTDGDGVNDNTEINTGRDPLSNQACPGYLCGQKYRGWRLAILTH